MAVQIAHAYAFCVKRKSLMQTPGLNSSTTADAGPTPAGISAYEGEQVYVLANSLVNAQAVLTAQYGTDLGPVTGGAQLVNGALTTMTGT